MEAFKYFWANDRIPAETTDSVHKKALPEVRSFAHLSILPHGPCSSGAEIGRRPSESPLGDPDPGEPPVRNRVPTRSEGETGRCTVPPSGLARTPKDG
jgi:hypothetical protein